MGLLSLRLPWQKDPYWDNYINRPPRDPNNLVPPAIRDTAEGQVYPIQIEVHAPEIMSDQIAELGCFFGADLVGVASVSGAEPDLPFAVVIVIAAEYDPRTVNGIGGQAAALTGGYVSFNIAAAIREYGFQAHRTIEADLDALARCAGLGSLDADGRLVTQKHGKKVYVADVVLTDLPLSPATSEVYEWARPTS